MTTIKTCNLGIRIEPRLKEALRSLAEREHRSIANMVEVLIRNHCAKNGGAIPPNVIPKVVNTKQAVIEKRAWPVVFSEPPGYHCYADND